MINKKNFKVNPDGTEVPNSEANATTWFDADLSFGGDGTSQQSMYGWPETVRTLVLPHMVEVIKVAKPQFSYTIHGYGSEPEPKVWKEIYEPVDGMIKHTKTIEGRYIPPQGETYKFDE